MTAAHPTLALIRSRYTDFGGAERFTLHILQGLAENGLEVTVLSRNWPEMAAIKSVLLNPPYLERLSRDLGFSMAVRQFLAKHSFDLVQSHERIPGVDLYRAGDGVHAAWLDARLREASRSERLAIKFSPYHRYVLEAEKALFAHPRLQQVVCNAQHTANEIQERFGLSATQITVIYNGVDTAHFHPQWREKNLDVTREVWETPTHVPLYLFVGSGYARKGLPLFLKALQSLPHEAYGWIVGYDREQERFKAIAQQMGLQNQVRFLGAQRDLAPIYGAADVFVLPTRYDPFPNVVLEAMASGLPVVTTFQTGAQEWVTPGKNGFLCDAWDQEALADAMVQAAANAREMGEASRRKVALQTWDTTAMAYQMLYQRLL